VIHYDIASKDNACDRQSIIPSIEVPDNPSRVGSSNPKWKEDGVAQFAVRKSILLFAYYLGLTERIASLGKRVQGEHLIVWI